MKITIMTDIEGCAGVMTFADWGRIDGRYHERGVEYLTMEVNAAIEGFCAAGATDITVVDGHGAGAIDSWLLDERAKLSRGWGRPHSFGYEDCADAIAWVGQHAKSGSIRAHLAHTGSHHVLDQKINGISVGEYGRNAMIAGFFGTPPIFGAGDQAFTEEVKTLTPWVHTVAVKVGATLTSGDECESEEYYRHNLGAVHLHPKRARQLIREGAEKALRDFAENRDKFPVLRVDPPYTMEVWYRKDGDKPARKVVHYHETDIVEMCSDKSIR